MNMKQFNEISNMGQCPSCRGTNLKKFPPTSSGGIPSYSCSDCGGFPAICNASGNGVVYVTHDRTKCPICYEDQPDCMTHALVM